MTIKILLSPLLLVALLLETIKLGTANNVGANERQYYETRICANCDYNYALATAAEIKPAINCTSGDDPFNSDTAQAQQCFATPIKILVVDANSRNIWHFENIYTNQGQPLYKLTNEVNYQTLIPASAITLVNQLLDIYEKMDELTVEYNDRWNAGEFDHITRTTNTVRSTEPETDSCDAYEYSDALDTVFSDKLKHFIQVDMQDQLFTSSSLLGGLFGVQLTSLSFNIGNSFVSVGGSWKVGRNAKYIRKIYGSGSINQRTQVTFTTSMSDDGLELTLNEIQTYFHGIPLKDLKAKTYPSARINECLGKALDKAYPKVVAGSGNSTPEFGNIALISGGGGHSLPGGGGGTTTCKHTYYINGNEVMSFEGTCP